MDVFFWAVLYWSHYTAPFIAGWFWWQGLWLYKAEVWGPTFAFKPTRAFRVTANRLPGLCSRVWSRGRFCCWGVKPSWSSPGCSHSRLAFLLESMSNFWPEMVDCGMFDWISVLWYLHVFHLFSITVGWLGFEGPKVYQALRICYSYRLTKPKIVLHWWVVHLSYTPSMTSFFLVTHCVTYWFIWVIFPSLWVSAGHNHFSVMKNSLHGRTWRWVK